MTYVEGFVAAVPAANKDSFRKHATDAAALFKAFGTTRSVETWGDDVPDGKVTDFKRAVNATQDEVVVFSWQEYPSKEARDAAMERIMSDPRGQEMGATMPFDGQRMIFGGFTKLLDESVPGGPAKMGYVDGFLIAVPADNKEAYRELAAKASAVFKENGALRIVEAWGDDVPDGKVTDCKRAVQATAGETVVFSWIEWPSKEARDEGWRKAMTDPRMQPDPNGTVFDGKRVVYGGFVPLVEG
jgi:uncharacterized protein YbaA (DUF1428 family)